MKNFFFTLTFSLLLFSCTSTNISSLKNPEVDFSSYKKILVFGNSNDIDFRKTLEADLVKEFSKQSVDAVSALDIISPFNKYTDDELKSLLESQNIDGYLTVTLVSSSRESSYIPEKTTTNYRTRKVNGTVITVPEVTTTGGYFVYYPSATFEIVLEDIKTGKIAFKSTARSQGDELSDMKTISKSLSKEIAGEYTKLKIQG